LIKRNKDENIYVFDTSSLISNPENIKNVDSSSKIIIPSVVLKQLDGLKNSDKENVAYNARKASNYILELQSQGRLNIENSYEKIDYLNDYADNKIVGTALRLKNFGKDVTLVTTDKNMQISSRNFNINCIPIKRTNNDAIKNIFINIFTFLYLMSISGIIGIATLFAVNNDTYSFSFLYTALIIFCSIYTLFAFLTKYILKKT